MSGKSAESKTKKKYKVTDAPKRTRRQRIVRWAAFLVLLGAVTGGATGLGVYLWYAPTVPHFESIEDYQPKVGTQVFSNDNQLVGEFAAERRVLVPFERVPPLLYQAFIAAEDKRFYNHFGVDVLGVMKAITDKIRNPGSKLRGASTITQQVAKSILVMRESYDTATERSLVRKIREAILARKLESKLSKNEILYMYVNQIFLGHKAYGVQAAAEHYFRKNVWELTIAEMATLAGLPQRPSDYSPFSRPEAAKSRREYVLRRMLAEGFIDQAQHDEAVDEELKVYPRRELYLQVAPYYTEQVRRAIVDRYGERALLEDGLKVYTSLNVEYQKHAQLALRRGLYALDRRQGWRGPIAKLDKELEALFKVSYRNHLELGDGEEPEFENHKLYLGIVKGFGGSHGGHAVLDIAGKEGLLPLAGMNWARDPDPTEKIDYHYVKDVRHRLRKGDLISVSLTDKGRLAKSRYGWQAIRSVPDEGDLFKLEQEPIAQSALLSVDPISGYVLAQVGGYHFEDSTFNRAVQACREPGSAFKPIVYSAAIDKLDYTASTLIDDKPLVYDDPDNEVRWKPNNAGLEFRGALPMRTCLQDSINTPAIRIAEAVGIDDTIKNARNLGVSTPLKRELGTALGSSCTTLLDLIRVYTTLNQYGQRRQIKFIRRVVDRYGNVLEDDADESDPTISLGARLDQAYADLVTPKEQALDPQSAFLTVSLMHNVVENGTGAGAKRTGQWIAGKTGTTDDSFDAWFMGFTKRLVTGVWVGHDKKERPLGVSEQGGRTALPIWADFVGSVLLDQTKKPAKRRVHGPMSPPYGVVRVSIDPETGLLARPESLSRVSEYYRSGSAPTEYAPDQKVFNPNDIDIWDADTPL